MKILLITYFYGITASGVISRRVAEQLASKGNDVLVLTQSSVLKLTADSNIKVVEVNNPLRRNDLLLRLLRKLEESSCFYYYDWVWVQRAVKVANDVIKTFKPDVIYCRTSPVEACYVGDILHIIYNIPVIQHFSDPVPAPLEYLPKSRKRVQIIRKVSKILRNASLVSYGNEAMLNYVQKETGVDLSEKSFISPDMASGYELKYLPFNSQSKLVVTYFGNIYGGRNPQPLFEALKQLTTEEIELEMRVYSHVDSIIQQGYPFVKSDLHSDDIINTLAEADILVDLDGDDSEPVFISSKLKDYLLINRPILSITPNNSPSSNLLNNLKTIIVVNNNKHSISQAIRTIMNMPKDIDMLYKEREPLISYFSPHAVGGIIVSKMADVLRASSN